MSAEWVGVGITFLMLLGSVGAIIWKLSALIKSLQDHKEYISGELLELKSAIGNGGGVLQRLRDIEVTCASNHGKPKRKRG
jgi:hypothetical protein